ncbi:PAS domain-containing protein [Pseudoroseomonas wenyumeiae]
MLAEARAELLRERLAVVLESVPGAFALCDAQGRLQLANSRFRRLFEHVGLGASLGALLPSGMGEQGAFDHGLRDGSWHRVTRQPLPDGGFTLGAVDITPLKRQEQILAARNVRQQALLELVPAGIWELDEAGRTVFANRQLANLLGAPRLPGWLRRGCGASRRRAARRRTRCAACRHQGCRWRWNIKAAASPAGCCWLRPASWKPPRPPSTRICCAAPAW